MNFRILIGFVFMCVMLVGQASILANDIVDNQNEQISTLSLRVGIPITMPAFKEKVTRALALIKDEKNLSISDYIEIVRIYNTVVGLYLNACEDSFAQYMKATNPKYILLAKKALEAIPTKGMGYYSKKYDIFIGAKEHQNSQYYIPVVTKWKAGQFLGYGAGESNSRRELKKN